MDKFAIRTELCYEVPQARRVLSKRKFDTVVLDFEMGDRVLGLLATTRLSTSNRGTPAIAITPRGPELSLTYYGGTNLVLQRPLTVDALGRTLRKGYGYIVREQRRYFRCPIQSRVTVRRADMFETSCRAVNISEGGMRLASAPPRLIAGTKVHTTFSLPYRAEQFTAICETRWRDNRNHVGLHFLLMPLEQRCDLREWLATRLEANLPYSIAEKFREANERFHTGQLNF